MSTTVVAAEARTLKNISIAADSVTFADPLNVSNTTSMKVRSSQQRLQNGVNQTFVRGEQVANRTVSLTKPGCEPCTSQDQILSVRIKFTLLPNDPISQQMLDDAFENARRAFTKGYANGFKPSPTDEFVIDFKHV